MLCRQSRILGVSSKEINNLLIANTENRKQDVTSRQLERWTGKKFEGRVLDWFRDGPRGTQPCTENAPPRLLVEEKHDVARN